MKETVYFCLRCLARHLKDNHYLVGGKDAKS